MLTDDFPSMIGPDVPVLESRTFSGELTSGDIDYVRLELSKGDILYAQADPINLLSSQPRIRLQGIDESIVDDDNALHFSLSVSKAWRIEETGTYFLSTVSGNGHYAFEIWNTDDHPDVFDSANIATISLNSWVNFVGETDDDRDVFAIDMERENFYLFDIEQMYSRTFSFLDENGNELERIERTDTYTAPGYDWIFMWRPPETGRFYVAATGRGNSFKVKLSATDDIPDKVTDATPLISFDLPTTGRTDANIITDVDVFAFDAKAGELLRVTTRYADVSLRVLNEDGTQVLASSPGTELDWIVPEDGRYHVAVSGFYTNDYELLLSPIVDDFVNQPASDMTNMVPNQPIAGRLDSGVDVDVFAFEAESGKPYSFYVQRASIISNSTISILDDMGSEQVRQFGSEVKWSPPTSGRYYVSITGTREVDYEVTMSTTSSLSLDVNGDGGINASDIDMLFAAVNDDVQAAAFDFNRDGKLDHQDNGSYLLQANIRPGDFDLDGEVTFADFLVLSSNFGSEGGWKDGDVDGNGGVDFADFLVLSTTFGSTPSRASALGQR